MAQAVGRFGDARAAAVRRHAPSPPRCRPSTPFRWRSGRGCRRSTGAARATDVMGYGEPFGHAALRQAIALHLRANRGIACDAAADLHRRRRAAGLPPDRLDAARPGRQGVVREPGRDRRAQQPDRRRRRPGAGAGRRSKGCAWTRACAWRRSSGSPSSRRRTSSRWACVMSLERRFALLQAAEQAGAWIIEDDYDGEFSLRRPAAADAEERRRHRAGDLRRHLQQVAVPVAAPGLPAGAAGAGRARFDAIMSRLLHGVPTAHAGGGRRLHRRRPFRRAHAAHAPALCRAPRGAVPAPRGAAGRRARRGAQPAAGCTPSAGCAAAVPRPRVVAAAAAAPASRSRRSGALRSRRCAGDAGWCWASAASTPAQIEAGVGVLARGARSGRDPAAVEPVVCADCPKWICRRHLPVARSPA